MHWIIYSGSKTSLGSDPYHPERDVLANPRDRSMGDSQNIQSEGNSYIFANLNI